MFLQHLKNKQSLGYVSTKFTRNPEKKILDLKTKCGIQTAHRFGGQYPVASIIQLSQLLMFGFFMTKLKTHPFKCMMFYG